MLVVSCAPVRLIGDYDPVTDEAVTRLHRNVETLLLAIERGAGDAAGYAAHEDVYHRLHVDLRSIQLRAAARERNELQVEQLRDLAANIERLREAHREGIRPEEVQLFRRGFDQQFGAILRLELARRPGEGR